MGPFWSTRILCGRGATLHAVRPTRSDGTALRATAKWRRFDIKELSSLTYPQKMARAITEVRLRHDTLPSDFRVPLPATSEAIRKGCTCPQQPKWPTVAFASDCPLHFVRTRPRR
jgi:hypothetical protein